MGFIIYYRGTLSPLCTMSDVADGISGIVNENKWTMNSNGDEISIDIPDFDTIRFDRVDGKTIGYIRYRGEKKDVIYPIVELLNKVRPYFSKFRVDEEPGLWDKYNVRPSTQFQKDVSPMFRELTDIEKAEFNRGFDLPAGYKPVWNVKKSHQVLLDMICKDMSGDLSKVMTLDKIMELVDDRCESFLKRENNGDDLKFMAVAETWFITKIRNESGREINKSTNRTSTCLVFAWFMTEVIFGFKGGSLGFEHQRLHRLMKQFANAGADFDNPEDFLRLVYTAIEVLEAYRPDELINRQ